jgi:hypothetical protein
VAAMSWGFRSVAVAALVCTLSALTATSAWAAKPANDDFAQREVLPVGFAGGLPVEATGSNVEATKEEGEFLPGLAPAGHSIWFEWKRNRPVT